MTVRPIGNMDNVHFFKYQHKPIDQHPEQMHHIVQRAKDPQVEPSRSRLTLCLSSKRVAFLIQYWNNNGKFFEFRGQKLNSDWSTMNEIFKQNVLKRKLTVTH